jgi:predicted dehydrogenase
MLVAFAGRGTVKVKGISMRRNTIQTHRVRGGVSRGTRGKPKVRFAVVGLGHIAQAAVLPAFAHAKNAELAALVSSDPEKLRQLGKRHKVPHLFSYEQYGQCLRSGEIDAVYIATPNHLHRNHAVQAAEAGIHVLCEKPLAVTEAECREMVVAADRHGVKLMTAYRLHFEKANLMAVDLVQKGRIGTPRLFNSVFCMQVREGDIRVRRQTGGGTLYDIGIYCINAARYLFREEPYEVMALTSAGRDPRFREVEEMTAAILRFPDDKLATFTVSFGASDTAVYRVVGSRGHVLLEQAYEYAMPIRLTSLLNGREQKRSFPVRDQFGPEILYFSDCILKDRDPEPSGRTGLNDIRIIEALYRSADTGKPMTLQHQEQEAWPGPGQAIDQPAVPEAELVHTEAPNKS